MTSTTLVPETSICTFRLDTPCCLGRQSRPGIADTNDGEELLSPFLTETMLGDQADATARDSAAQTQNAEPYIIMPLQKLYPRHPLAYDQSS